MWTLIASIWVMSTYGVWANPGGDVWPVSQIGVVKNVFVGKMDCSARMLDANHVQTWCSKAGKTVSNQVSELQSDTVLTWYYYDSRPGEEDAMITWLIARVQDNPQTVGYNVAFRWGSGKDHLVSGQF